MYIFTPDKDTSFLTKWECALAPQNVAHWGPWDLSYLLLYIGTHAKCARARKRGEREREKRRRRWCRPKTSFAAESGQIMKNQTFSNLLGLNLCTSHIRGFGCLRSRCGRIVKKSSRKDSWYQDYSVLLTAAPRLGGSRQDLSPNPPQTFERKLSLFWLKEALIKI